MRRTTLALSSLLIMMLILISGIIVYYQDRLANKDSDISSLTSQITNQTIEIQNLTGQIENLTTQLRNMTSQVEDLSGPPTAVIESIALDPNFYPLVGVSVSIPINVVFRNIGTSAIYNATLTAENLGSTSVPKAAYSASTTIPVLGAGVTLQTNSGVCGLFLDVSIDKMAQARSLDYLVTLSVNGAVLDQEIYYHISQ